MKHSLILAAVSATLLTSAAFAGESYVVEKNPVPAAAPTLFGTGWYFGLQAGINAYQDFGGEREFTVGGRDIRLDNSSQIGFVGGLKAGYVFGTGLVRPALEADLFYNGVRGDLDVSGADVNADANLHSGAFMGNFLIRFALDRFQPYLGAGAGVWIGQADDVDVTVRGKNYTVDASGNNGFAWQLIGGADYYFAEKFSVFGEYKYLNYEDAGIQSDRIDQHIVVLGVRWHF